MLATDVSGRCPGPRPRNAVGHAVADRATFRAEISCPMRRPPFDLVLANLLYVRHDAMAGLPTRDHVRAALALTAASTAPG